MPFFRLVTPSISLSNLRGALEASGFACDLKHLNVEMGKRLGLDLYTWIAELAPVPLLFADLVFAPLVYDRRISSDRLKELAQPFRTARWPNLAEALEVYSDLVESARAFVTDMLHEIEWSEYPLVGFNTMFHVAPSLAMARRLKAALPNPPKVIFGGSNCEGEMGESIVRQFPFVDYVCRGEGERLIVELARHLEDGNSTPEEIQGLVWRKDGEIVCNGLGASVIRDLDSLPRPRYDDWLYEIRQSRLVDDSWLSLPIETARGCWYGEKQHCTFCGLNGQTMMFRSKSSKRAVAEFTDLLSRHPRTIYGVDNILDFRYFTELLPELAKLKHDCEIHYEIKSNVTYEQMCLLRASGCTSVQPGIESLSTSVLRLMRKGVTAAQNIRILKWAAELGVCLIWNMLYGFPDENPKDYVDMAALIPLLTHLPPPAGGCHRVRIDRFSPLFTDRIKAGAVRPVESYRELYPFESEIVGRMAHYFEHDHTNAMHTDSYIAALGQAVRGWLKESGRAAFICFSNNPGLRLVDTRAVAIEQRAILHGLEEDVFKCCLNGAAMHRLCRTLGRSESELLPILESFIDRRWAIQLDAQYITLGVPMDAYVPRDLPPKMMEDVVRDVYCARMAHFRIRQSVNMYAGFTNAFRQQTVKNLLPLNDRAAELRREEGMRL
jgi:ribosomal peptide maturation radical SAM protein 1